MSKNNKKGFTIIEVVLVLAIAGLIFLMVFIALPALQRSQRDTQRRSDVGRVMSQLNSYQTNNRGNLPADINAMNGSFMTGYMKPTGTTDQFADPQSGDQYTFGDTASTKVMEYKTKSRCNGENIVANGTAARSVAVRIKLEGSGYYCQDNQ